MVAALAQAVGAVVSTPFEDVLVSVCGVVAVLACVSTRAVVRA